MSRFSRAGTKCAAGRELVHASSGPALTQAYEASPEPAPRPLFAFQSLCPGMACGSQAVGPALSSLQIFNRCGQATVHELSALSCHLQHLKRQSTRQSSRVLMACLSDPMSWPAKSDKVGARSGPVEYVLRLGLRGNWVSQKPASSSNCPSRAYASQALSSAGWKLGTSRVASVGRGAVIIQVPLPMPVYTE